MNLPVKPQCKFFLALILSLTVFNLTAFAADQKSLVCAGAKVYPSPTAPPIEDAVVIVNDGKITAVAAKGRVKLSPPGSALNLDCAGKVVVAGFCNSHVHFSNGWDHAATAPVNQLAGHMHEMLTRWGFTTVWDLGSEPGNTLALRRRVDAGEVPGPRILMAGDIFPKNGHPVYLASEVLLPEAATPQEAEQMSQQYMKMGLEGIKLFTGSFMGPKPVVNMDTDIVKAAVDLNKEWTPTWSCWMPIRLERLRTLPKWRTQSGTERSFTGND